MDVCEEYQKEQKLARLLEEIGCEPQNKILIFVETKRKADDLTRLMRRDGYVHTSGLTGSLLFVYFHEFFMFTF